VPNQPATETELLRAAYAAFNARDIDAALALMTPDVERPRAFKGDFVRGPEEIRAYWTEQWTFDWSSRLMKSRFEATPCGESRRHCNEWNCRLSPPCPAIIGHSFQMVSRRRYSKFSSRRSHALVCIPMFSKNDPGCRRVEERNASCERPF
jgi:hypothetical protein